MSKLNINFNNKNFEVDPASLSEPRADFISHLGTIAGEGLKIIVDGVEYSVDPTKLNGAVISLEAVLNNLNAGGDVPTETLAPGLYQTGAIALYEEQGVEAVEGMMITSWDELLADGTVHVEYGVVYTNVDYDEWTNTSSDALAGDLILPNDGSIVAIGNFDYDAEEGHLGFTLCENLTGIFIPNSVTSISAEAFEECYSLTSIVIPDSVTSIGEDVFYGCLNLTSAIISNNVMSGGEGLFYDCASLTSVTIGNHFTNIAAYAFYGCTSLTSVTIPDGVTNIGYSAFYNCSGLTSIVIPNSVTNIDDCVFYNCTNLTTINYTGTKSQWAIIEKGEYWDDATRNYTIYCTDGNIPKELPPS